VCSFVLPVPYFARDAVRSARQWRLPFIAGLVLGGFVSALLGGGFSRRWDLGMFDHVIGFGPAGKLAWMLSADCSSVSARARRRLHQRSWHLRHVNFELPSLISTLSFMAAAS
jgi:hypothetical protein